MDKTNKQIKISNEYLKALKELTPREIQILDMVAEARTSKGISRKLKISEDTVKTHRANICKKLGLEGHRGLIRWCRKHINGLGA